MSAALHFKKWTYVESAELASARVLFRFSPSSKTPGPFGIEFKLLNISGQVLGSWTDEEYQANDKLIMSLHREFDAYAAELTLDGALAYRSTFTSQDALL